MELNIDELKKKYYNKNFIFFYFIIFIILYIIFSFIKFLGQIPILLVATFFISEYFFYRKNMVKHS
jgi:uncharacterized membrane protein